MLGSNNISDVLDRYESLKKSRERTAGKLESLEEEIEKQRADVDQLQVQCDEPGTSNPQNSPDDDTAADKQ